MIRIKEAIIVEGKYDKIKLSSFVEGLILTTEGFQIFKDREKMELLRSLAKKRGLLILTDSDGAGFLIRHHLTGSIDNRFIKHCYIPDVLGKERRKEKPSAEGKLGVEGMDVEILVQALRNAGVAVEAGDGTAQPEKSDRPVTKLDFFEDGLSGRPDSAARRKKYLAAQGLPERLSANALLDVVNAMFGYEEYKRQVETLFFK